MEGKPGDVLLISKSGVKWANEKRVLKARKDAAVEEIIYCLQQLYPECGHEIISNHFKWKMEDLEYMCEKNN